jgi:hypothetical protein
MSEGNLAVDLVLALYVNSYQSPSKPLPTITISNGGTSKPKKTKKASPAPGQHPPKASSPKVVSVKAPVSQAAPSRAPMTIGLPAVGSLNAEGFFFALRHAGMRKNDQGRLVRHPLLIQQDEKLAIAAYIGYNFTAPFGSQLEQARLKARFTLRPEKNGKEYKRGTSATLAGFIKGCPDLVKKHLEDLLSREQLAADLVIGYERSADEATHQDDRLIFTGKALVERERLSVIRQDLITLATIRAQAK